MVKKLRVSLALQPVATALFASFAFPEGRPNGFKSFRSAVWLDTDPDRTGMLPFVFEPGFGFERYVDYALGCADVFRGAQRPLYRLRRRKLPPVHGGQAAAASWRAADLARTGATISRRFFPKCGSSSYLEMRGADSGPWRRLCALPALWTGVLYDERSLDGAWELVKGWSASERQAMRETVPRLALQAEIAGRTVQEIAKDMLALSRAGLERRRRLGCKGRSEAQFLDVLDDIAETGRTRAEDLLDHYDSDWNGDVTRVFRDFAF